MGHRLPEHVRVVRASPPYPRRSLGYAISCEIPESVAGTSFAEEGGITTITTVMDFGSKEARDAAVKTGMTDGMEQSYQLLDRVLQEPGI